MKKDEEKALKAVSKATNQKVIFWGDPENKNLKTWKEAGKPRVLLKLDKYGPVSLWQDCSGYYGRLFLIKGEEVISQARNFVSANVGNYTYIGLSQYYDPSISGLYRKKKSKILGF